MSYPVIFQLSEVADVLELPKSTVKNWTLGRPLTITPSIRAGSGTGSSNLYGITDVYLMAIAAQLTRDGFTTDVVKEVLTAVKPKVGSLGKVIATLLISSPGRQLQIKLVHRASGIPIAQASELSRYTLNLEKLIERVQQRIEEPPQRQSQFTEEES